MAKAPTDPKDPLTEYWGKPVSQLVDVENAAITPQEAERHAILSLLAMALVADAFNGNKRGAVGSYPWRTNQKIEEGRYSGDRFGDRYFGHNIGCLAVDGRGEIIDFEFNHNELYNSSAEHAEARLVRRIFNLSQIFDNWATADPNQIADIPYANILSAVTLYTTLESCAQCSGIMTLGNVKRVVYLQSDPGQYRVGNIMYNLSNPLGISNPSTHPPKPGDKPLTKYGAPEPVPASLFAFSYQQRLEDAYDHYAANAAVTEFYKAPNGRKDHSSSITSFLCTDAAKDLFDEAAAELDTLKPAYPDYVPATPAGAPPALSNAEVLKQARQFRIYAARVARRGTPHR